LVCDVGGCMSAVPASTVSLKTMADGTLRISFDVEPGQAQDAFKLFAAPGTQVAIAALKDGSFLEQSKEVDRGLNIGLGATINIAEPKPREQLGDACYRTVLWCNEPSFWNFVNGAIFTNDADVLFVDSVVTAADAVKNICKVYSRKELDTDPEANKTWHREIRQPYADYLKRLEAA